MQDVNGTHYVHSDHLDAPRAATNTSGRVVWKARYEAFGKAIVDQDPDGNSVAVTLNIRFPGQYFDAESGLHQNFKREYDPALGRYLQADPIPQSSSPNPYLYTSSNPVNEIDPTGEIVPALILYGRCVAECVALAAIEAQLPGGKCFDFEDSLADRMQSCLNPLNWFKFKKYANVAGKAGGAMAAAASNAVKKAKKPRNDLPSKGEPNSSDAKDK